MKTLKTTLGLFTLSTLLFSFAPQTSTNNTTDSSDITEPIVLEQVYQFEETILQKEEKGQE